jgi:uncharacterized protein YfbU (UPF0304 family)
MFAALRSSYDRFEDKRGINKSLISFDGFNRESPIEAKFCRFFDRIASPIDRLPYYQRLLEAWKRSKDRQNLTREDLLRILDQASFKELPRPGRTSGPSSRSGPS